MLTRQLQEMRRYVLTAVSRWYLEPTGPKAADSGDAAHTRNAEVLCRLMTDDAEHVRSRSRILFRLCRLNRYPRTPKKSIH